MAQLCQIYGIPAKYGRLYATLFLTPRAMSLTELAERSDTAKSILAKKMIDTARNTADDPAARYVLLRVARDIGVQAGDIVLVMGGGRSYVIAERLVSLLEGRSAE